MFTPENRTRLRDALVAGALGNHRITAAALTGSAAGGAEDRRSDVAQRVRRAPERKPRDS